MSTSHFFNNRIIKLPGAYAVTRAESPAVFTAAPYGKVLIINTKPEYAFGGSVNGSLTKGTDALYKFRTLPEAQAFFKSGYLWYLAEKLFRPSRLTGRQGVSELQFINALTSTAPTLEVKGGGSAPSTAGSTKLTIAIKDETGNAAGVKKSTSATTGPSDNLKSGYALSLEAGVVDTSKYIIKIWQGTYKGVWTDGISYDGVSVEGAVPELVLASPEIASVQEFVAWAKNNETFNYGFAISGTPTEYTFTAYDKTENAFVLASSVTPTYSANDLTKVLSLLTKGDYSIILSLNKVGDTDADTINATLQYYVESETRFKKYLVVAAEDTFTTAINSAKTFNSEFVWDVYGSPRISSSLSPLGYREFDSLCMAALVTGRIAGLPPQVPGTFKDLAIDGLKNPLSEINLETALDAGLMTVNYDDDLAYFCITRAINTLQNNTQLQNPDGSTFSIQISRICTQLNTDVVINAKKQIFQSNDSANLHTVSTKFLENWIKSYLASKIATPQQDNLILSVEDVSVEKNQDALYATYKFKPNSEVAFLFFTGVAIY